MTHSYDYQEHPDCCACVECQKKGERAFIAYGKSMYPFGQCQECYEALPESGNCVCKNKTKPNMITGDCPF